MRIRVLHNPTAGRQAATALAEAFDHALRAAGHEVEFSPVGKGSPRLDLPVVLREAEAVVVIGGDGTVQRAAAAISGLRIPLYHVPAGNENLFARHFRMSRSPADLVAALESPRSAQVDLGIVRSTSHPGGDEHPFTLMCSVGYDANVVHRLAAARPKRVGSWTYVPHAMRELRRPALAPLLIEVDGEPIVSAQRGTVVIANSRQYACRLDPAPGALMDDGQLDVVFLPHRTRLGLLGRAIQARGRRLGASREAVTARGTTVRIASLGRPMLVQIDGEAPARSAQGASNPPLRTPIELTVRAAALTVLRPVSAQARRGFRPPGEDPVGRGTRRPTLAEEPSPAPVARS